MNENDTELGDIQSQIAQARKQLDSVYRNRVEEENLKFEAEQENSRLFKYQAYLNDQCSSLEEEVSKKKQIISDLDSEIADKQVQFDALQGSVASSKAAVDAAESRLKDIEQTIAQEQDASDARVNETNIVLVSAQVREQEAQSLVTKIRDFLNAL